MSSSVVPFSSTSAWFLRRTEDMHATVFAAFNLDIEAGISIGNFEFINERLAVIEKMNKECINRYVQEGSYYSALVLPMRQGKFQQVYDALIALEKNHVGLQTLEIRICKAVCMLQIGKINECDLYIEERGNMEILNLLTQAIQKAHAHEKKAYQDFLNYYQMPPQSE